MNILDGKKALVTGAANGLGRGIAHGITRHGALVIGMDQSDEVFEREKEGVIANAIQADLASRGALRAGFAKAMEYMSGHIDILVNCAGIQRRHPCEEFPLDDWDDVLEVNLTAVFELCQLAGQQMIAQKNGKIINIASLNCFFGGIRIPAYAASKGGVMQLTRSLANAWASYGINVNAIAPGYMTTDMNSALLQDAGRSAAILSRIPAGRWGAPADMVGPCVFLASNLSDYVHGAILPVDGGYLSF